MKNGASSAFAPFPSATLDAGHRVAGDDVLGARERTRRGTGRQQRTGSDPTQAAAGGESSPDPLQGQAEGGHEQDTACEARADRSDVRQQNLN